VIGLEVREIPVATEPWVHTYGTIGCGLETMRLAWPSLKHRFSVRNPEASRCGVATVGVEHITPGTVPKLNLLTRFPVDVLAVERGHMNSPPTKYKPERWETLVDSAIESNHPKVVVEMHPPGAELWEKGPACKSTRTRWADRGYVSRFHRLNATNAGGAIAQTRFIVIRVQLRYSSIWTWAMEDPSTQHRPMSNLLTPPGLVRFSAYGVPPSTAPNARDEPMPSTPGAWIRTEKGTRRLQLEESARGLGVPKEWNLDPRALSASVLLATTSVFHWEYLSSSLLRPALPSEPLQVSVPVFLDQLGQRFPMANVEANPTFSWKPPDLSPGGEWYELRVSNLRKAAATLPNSTRLVEDGLLALAVHRKNYSETGPDAVQLQLLWWEFPSEHWEGLREGSRMNFLQSPPPCIHPNTPMDAEQRLVAAAFVDELLDLAVLGQPTTGEEVLLNAPLFVIPKEGQDGQWRVISDMLRGGQNDCISSDPVYLPRLSHILDQMYSGGFSAVADASKFFYQFPTHPLDRPFLGLLHPVTGILYQYYGLPMGGANSPALASRYGLSFIRMLREKSADFQGAAAANCWWTGFASTGEYNPELGYGYVLTSADGPAVKIWVWVDDFLIHGPTYEKTARALTFFLNTAVDVGLLCHPLKLTPPCQVVKYCGTLLDSVGIPCQRIPIDKRERALAIVEHLLDAPSSQVFSRLSLAVAAGVLESLVDATPLRLGHTYLRRFHSVVHPPDLGTGAAPYYTTATVPPDVKDDLRWWRRNLLLGQGRFARSHRSATLVPNWGDGSGTGTGGTLGLPDRPLKMWMGQWSPVVYKFSSNWKELMTLKLSLLNILQEGAPSARGTTIFYFTDNMAVYWISASGSTLLFDTILWLLRIGPINAGIPYGMLGFVLIVSLFGFLLLSWHDKLYLLCFRLGLNDRCTHQRCFSSPAPSLHFGTGCLVISRSWLLFTPI
jgi:hypothetical protein